MLDDINIREFSVTDKKLVDDFFCQMGGESRAFFNRNDGNYKNVQKFFLGEDKNTIRFLAKHQDEMIGYVFLWDTDKKIPWLGIAVADEYKGKHLGRELFKTAISYCEEKEKGGILLTTHTANIRGQGLYERMGFERIGIHTSGEILYLLIF